MSLRFAVLARDGRGGGGEALVAIEPDFWGLRVVWAMGGGGEGVVFDDAGLVNGAGVEGVTLALLGGSPGAGGVGGLAGGLCGLEGVVSEEGLVLLDGGAGRQVVLDGLGLAEMGHGHGAMDGRWRAEGNQAIAIKINFAPFRCSLHVTYHISIRRNPTSPILNPINIVLHPSPASPHSLRCRNEHSFCTTTSCPFSEADSVIDLRKAPVVRLISTLAMPLGLAPYCHSGLSVHHRYLPTSSLPIDQHMPTCLSFTVAGNSDQSILIAPNHGEIANLVISVALYCFQAKSVRWNFVHYCIPQLLAASFPLHGCGGCYFIPWKYARSQYGICILPEEEEDAVKKTKQLEYAQRATLRATTVLVAGPAPCAAVIVLRRRSLQVRRTNNHIHISSRCRRRPDRFMNRGPSSATLPYPSAANPAPSQSPRVASAGTRSRPPQLPS